MGYFDNMIPYYLENGKLCVYPNNRVFIKGRYFRVDNEGSFNRIKKCELMKEDDEGVKINEKYVFRIHKADSSRDEVCLKLDFFHSLLFCLSFLNLKDVLIGFLRIVKRVVC